MGDGRALSGDGVPPLAACAHRDLLQHVAAVPPTHTASGGLDPFAATAVWQVSPQRSPRLRAAASHARWGRRTRVEVGRAPRVIAVRNYRFSPCGSSGWSASERTVIIRSLSGGGAGYPTTDGVCQ